MYTAKTDPRRNQITISVVPGRAADLAAQVELCLHKIAKSKPEEMGLGLSVASLAGNHQVSWMCAIGAETLMISSVDGKTLVLPVEQCAFTFEFYSPTSQRPKRTVGFVPPREND